MPSLLKRIFVGCVMLLTLALAAAGVYLFGVLPLSQPPADIAIVGTPEQIERGRYLTVNVLQCIDCHSERDWNYYGGPPKPPIGAGRACMTRETVAAGVNAGQETFPGKLCVRNITPDPETGIGEWTAGEIIRATREGVNREGDGLFPMMPYFIYAAVSDADMAAVVAYLRTLEPVQSIRPERQIDFPLNMMVQMWPQPITEAIATPDPDDSVAYGEYLATIGRCEFCHTRIAPRSMRALPGAEFAGGKRFYLNGKTMYSMNLTPHESGLGSWTREQFIDVFKSRAQLMPADPADNTLMNWVSFGGMTEQDIGAMYDFFMTLVPVPFEAEAI